MMTRLYLALLWVGARIVREQDRAEWQAEWQTELWYAIEEGGGRSLLPFCLGSWRDAMWRRRNAGIKRHYGSMLMLTDHAGFPDPPAIACAHPFESPYGCLAVLGVLAILAVWAQTLAAPSSLSGRALFVEFLPACAFCWPIAVLTSGPTSGEYPRHRNWALRGCFFLAKVTFLLVIVAFGVSGLVSSPGRINIAVAGAYLAIRWAVLDQCRRCPTCLRILEKPVRMGSGSRILLEWNGTELLCTRGHGVMHIPETPAIWFSRPRWSSLG